MSNGNHGLIQVSWFYFSFFFFICLFLIVTWLGGKILLQNHICTCKFCPKLFPHLCMNSVNARDFKEQINIYLWISSIRIQLPKYPRISFDKVCHYIYFSSKRIHHLQIFWTGNYQKLLVHSRSFRHNFWDFLFFQKTNSFILFLCNMNLPPHSVILHFVPLQTLMW